MPEPMGFIPKTSTPAILQTAVRLVLANEIYVPSTGLRRRDDPRVQPLRSLGCESCRKLGLTPRLQRVCALMVKGRPVKQIARDLDISVATVKVHLQPILRALGVMNRTEAIVALHRSDSRSPTDYSRRPCT